MRVNIGHWPCLSDKELVNSSSPVIDTGGVLLAVATIHPGNAYALGLFSTMPTVCIFSTHLSILLVLLDLSYRSYDPLV